MAHHKHIGNIGWSKLEKVTLLQILLSLLKHIVKYLKIAVLKNVLTADEMEELLQIDKNIREIEKENFYGQ